MSTRLLSRLFVLGMATAIGFSALGEQPEIARPRAWEYSLRTGNAGAEEAELNSLGVQGWELVHVDTSKGAIRYFLKRPKQEAAAGPEVLKPGQDLSETLLLVSEADLVFRDVTGAIAGPPGMAVKEVLVGRPKHPSQPLIIRAFKDLRVADARYTITSLYIDESWAVDSKSPKMQRLNQHTRVEQVSIEELLSK